MARLLWAVLAHRIITDSETNSASYIDLIEAFAVPQFPAQLPQFAVATLWQRESEEDDFVMRITIVDPHGNNIANALQLPPQKFGANQRYRVNVLLGGTVIKEPGFHQVRIELQKGTQWQQVALLQLEISAASAPVGRVVIPGGKRQELGMAGQ